MDLQDLKHRLNECIQQAIVENDRNTLHRTLKLAATEVAGYNRAQVTYIEDSGPSGVMVHRNSKGDTLLGIYVTSGDSLQELYDNCKVQTGLV